MNRMSAQDGFALTFHLVSIASVAHPQLTRQQAFSIGRCPSFSQLDSAWTAWQIGFCLATTRLPATCQEGT